MYNSNNHLVDGVRMGINSENVDLIPLATNHGDKGTTQGSNIRVDSSKPIAHGMHYIDTSNCVMKQNVVNGTLILGIGGKDVEAGGTLTCSNNSTTRDSGLPTDGANQDHAIYLGEIIGATVNGNTTTGWAIGANGGFKLKNVKKVNFYGNTLNTSGFLGRVLTDTGAVFTDIYIHDNTVNAQGIIIWTPDAPPTQIRISGNKVYNSGYITAKRDVTTSFNNTLSYGVAGGVYDNTSPNYDLAAEITKSGNQ
jgi:hypothetical protein